MSSPAMNTHILLGRNEWIQVSAVCLETLCRHHWGAETMLSVLCKVLPHCASGKLITNKIKKRNSFVPNAAMSKNTKRPNFYFFLKQFLCKSRDSGCHKRWWWGVGHRSSFRSGDVRGSQKITSKPDYVLLLSDKKVNLHGHRRYLLVTHWDSDEFCTSRNFC